MKWFVYNKWGSPDEVKAAHLLAVGEAGVLHFIDEANETVAMFAAGQWTHVKAIGIPSPQTEEDHYNERSPFSRKPDPAPTVQEPWPKATIRAERPEQLQTGGQPGLGIQL